MRTVKAGKAGLKVLAYALLGFLLLTVLESSKVLAKLLVFSPDNVLSVSDAIVVGTITAKKENGSTVEATIRVERVLEGTVKSRYIELCAGPYIPKGSPPDTFPDKGARVFIALRGTDNEGWRLTSDLNAVGVVENGHVSSIHNGFEIGIDNEHWEPRDYVSSYDRFYRSHMTWFERVSEWVRNLFR